MRKKYNIKELEGNDPTAMINISIFALVHTIISILIGVYLKGYYLSVVLIGWLVGGYFGCAAGLAIHEASHGLIFKTRNANFIAGMIGELPIFFPAFTSFKHYHIPHHSYITIDLDENNAPEKHDNKKLPKYDTDLPTEFEARMFSHSWFTRLLFVTF